MKKIILFLISLSVIMMSKAQEPKFEWAKKMGGSADDAGTALFVDVSGNIYTTGYFSGSADFDPGVGTFELEAIGGVDVYVSKSDANGNFIWARAMGGPSNEVGRAIVVDVSGSVYTTGTFSGTTDFDPDTFLFNLTAAGTDIFISKLDANGVFLWAKKIGGGGTDNTSSVAIDVLGNVYATGSFFGTVDFNPGTGVFNLTTIPSDRLDIFVLKLKSNGSFLWAKKIGGLLWDEGTAVAVDEVGNVYATGVFQSIVDFDPGSGIANLTATADDDAYILKLDSAGNFLWAKKLGGKAQEKATSIALDGKGNVIVAGVFQDTVDFDPDPGIFNLVSAGSNDIFISKFDTSGKFVWADRMGGMQNDAVFSVTSDAAGNVFSTGNFAETADFDPGPDTFNLIATGGNNLFISKLDEAGKFVWTKNIGGPNYDYSVAVKVDLSGNIYTIGYFGGTTDFNPGTDTFSLTSAGAFDIFVHKMNIKTGVVEEKGPLNQVTIYPNPVSSILTIENSSGDKNITLQLLDITEKMVLNEMMESNKNTIDLSALKEGLYVIRITGATGVFNRKLVVKR